MPAKKKKKTPKSTLRKALDLLIGKPEAGKSRSGNRNQNKQLAELEKESQR